MNKEKISIIVDVLTIIFFLGGLLCLKEVIETSYANAFIKKYACFSMCASYFFLLLARKDGIEKERD